MDAISGLREKYLTAIAAASDEAALEAVRLAALGKKGEVSGLMRGLGAMPNVFAMECCIDDLAARVGKDPVEYRLSILADARARAVIEKVAAMAKWQRGAAGGQGRGRGIAFARYKNRAGYAAVVVELSVDEDIRLHHVWCAADAGLVVNPDGAINQLEGGIVTYGKDPEVQGRLFDGSCYVFDERVTVPVNQTEEARVISHCHYCGTESERYVNCANLDCDHQFLCCVNCEFEHRRSCSPPCEVADNHEYNPETAGTSKSYYR